MIPQGLLPRLPGIDLQRIDFASGEVIVFAASNASVAECPSCGTASHRVHSRYGRTLADKPITSSRPLRFRIAVRRFVCDNDECPRTIFAEPLDALATPRARTTAELTEAHTAIGFAAGGEPGARLADSLDMPTSPDTLLRRVKAAELDPGPPPRYVGIDDWAIRKGQNYGTAVVDLERRRVVALLPGRDGEAIAQWLRDNPQVEVISRDRWPAYAKAATEAAPQAKQVADRWHLLKNLREVVEESVARLTPEIRGAATPEPAAPEFPATPNADAPGPTETSPPSAGDAKRRARRERRQRVRDLKAEGQSARQIARQLGMSTKTVLRILRTSDCEKPHGNLGRRRATLVDAYRDEIETWLAAGNSNTADLYRLLKSKGCKASYDAVRRYANRRLGSSGQPGRRSAKASKKPVAPEVPSSRKLSFQFVCAKPSESGEPSFLDRVRSKLPTLDAALKVAGELADMLRRKVSTTLREWLAKARGSGVAELERFAGSLSSDEAAVSAALTEPWSNGQVEGQVGRLKAIKRGYYGRAGMELLSARVLKKG